MAKYLSGPPTSPTNDPNYGGSYNGSVPSYKPSKNDIYLDEQNTPDGGDGTTGEGTVWVCTMAPLYDSSSPYAKIREAAWMKVGAYRRKDTTKILVDTNGLFFSTVNFFPFNVWPPNYLNTVIQNQDSGTPAAPVYSTSWYLPPTDKLWPVTQSYANEFATLWIDSTAAATQYDGVIVVDSATGTFGSKYDSTIPGSNTGNGWSNVSISSSTVGNTSPPNPNPGQLWYDSGIPALKIWDGAAWTTV
jgi:hypothetical protein